MHVISSKLKHQKIKIKTYGFLTSFLRVYNITL